MSSAEPPRFGVFQEDQSMFVRHLVSGIGQLGVCALAVMLAATPAAARSQGDSARPKSKEEGRACANAFRSAQEREQGGHLLEARDLWQSCAKNVCGDFLQKECSTRHAQLESDIPTVIPVVTDQSGASRVDVEVKMDGQLLTSKLDGRALPVDPGLHEFTFKAGGDVFAGKILIGQGQRNRAISVVLHAADRNGHTGTLTVSDRPVPVELAPPELTLSQASAGAAVRSRAPTAAAPAVPRDSKPAQAAHAATAPAPAAVPVAAPARQQADTAADEPSTSAGETATASGKGPSAFTWVLAGVGVAGASGFGLLTYWGRKDNDALAACSPRCAPADVDHIKRMYLGANVSLGVGIAALGAAYWVYRATRGAGEETGEKEVASYRLDVQPAPSGAVASVSGSF
jgi:hypothetical protein